MNQLYSSSERCYCPRERDGDGEKLPGCRCSPAVCVRLAVLPALVLQDVPEPLE